jgi:hypothetical protein
MLKGSAVPHGDAQIRGIAVILVAKGQGKPGRVPGILESPGGKGNPDREKVPEKVSSSGMLPVRSGMQDLRRI